MNNKTLATLFVGKVKGILKKTEDANKKVTKDTTLDKPIQSDVVLSNKAAAYDEIFSEFKKYHNRKNELKESSVE